MIKTVLRRCWLLVPIAAVVAAGFALTTVGLPKGAYAQSGELEQGSFGTWRYTAYLEGRVATALVTHELNRASDVDAFLAENRRLVGELQQQGVTEAQVVVTFRTLQDRAALEQWVSSTPIRPASATARVASGPHGKGTLGLPISRDNLTRDLNAGIDFLATFHQQGKIATNQVSGYYGVDGTANLGDIETILRHPSVAAVDVSGAYAKRRVEANPAVSSQRTPVTVVAKPIYYQLETLGLAR
ncbi:MAG: hypothetical protein U0556_01360 [Dehalococcoidia bacterium]